MTDMRKNEYSIEVADKYYIDGDDKRYRWHLECTYSHNDVIMAFLVYDKENHTYVTEKGTNMALEINAKDILSSADYDKVVAMMMEYVGESN